MAWSTNVVPPCPQFIYVSTLHYGNSCPSPIPTHLILFRVSSDPPLSLRQVVAKERPDIEKRKTQLLLRMAEDKKQLSDLEARILHLLSNSSGNILDDEASVPLTRRKKSLSYVCLLLLLYGGTLCLIVGSLL